MFFMILLFMACGNESPEVHEREQSRPADPTLEKLNARVEAEPENAEAYAERGSYYYEQEAYDQALSDLNKALELDSTNINYLHLLADVYMDYYQSQKALNTMLYAASLYPERIPTLLKLSEFQLILKQHDAALKTVGRILSLNPENAEAYFMLGTIYLDQGEKGKAKQAYFKAVSYDSKLIDGWLQLAELSKEEAPKEALRYYDNALRIAPENITALHEKAYLLSNYLDDLPAALEVYRQIVLNNPQYSDAYYNSGLLYLDMDSIAQAREQFDLAVEMDPTFVKAYFFRGVAEELSGQPDLAKADYEQALRLDPEYEKAREALARLEEKD